LKNRDQWTLYVAECADGSYYTGIAKDIAKRIETHNAGKGSKYTATHRPVKLVFQEPQADYSAALRREYQIKSLPKARKVRFVSGETLPRPPKKAKMSFQRRKPKADTKPRRRKGQHSKDGGRTGKIKNHGPLGT
jgi:putative endonuclease